MSINRLRNLYHPNTNQTASDAAGIPDNVLSGEVGTHTNAATITNSGNSSVTLNADPTATPANENSQDPSVSAQMLLNMLQPLLDVSRELNKTAINNLSNNSNKIKGNETI
ncbi:hypothetical protein [Ectobacillus polymachus]|uniref:hypothetical protein n=1 Tax=Ectobacillus polymachus TaxID=1508806 RepID=UPI003A8B0C8C